MTDVYMVIVLENDGVVTKNIVKKHLRTTNINFSHKDIAKQ